MSNPDGSVPAEIVDDGAGAAAEPRGLSTREQIAMRRAHRAALAGTATVPSAGPILFGGESGGAPLGAASAASTGAASTGSATTGGVATGAAAGFALPKLAAIAVGLAVLGGGTVALALPSSPQEVVAGSAAAEEGDGSTPGFSSTGSATDGAAGDSVSPTSEDAGDRPSTSSSPDGGDRSTRTGQSQAVAGDQGDEPADDGHPSTTTRPDDDRANTSATSVPSTLGSTTTSGAAGGGSSTASTDSPSTTVGSSTSSSTTEDTTGTIASSTSTTDRVPPSVTPTTRRGR